MTDVVWRDVHRGRVWRAQACRLVEDSPELAALWMPRGSRAWLPADAAGRRIRIPGEEWTLEPVTTSRNALCLARPGRAHSLYVFWREGFELEHWYVNLEQPLRRNGAAFDTFDEKLDLIVRPDGTYEWKDEDELEAAAAAGLLDPVAVRAEAARVLEEWPFPTGWEDWRPDPAWPLPELPEGWERV